MFYRRFLFFFRHAFSEVHRPIAVKLCHIIGTRLNFITQVQKFGVGRSPTKNGGAKHAKFRSISCNFRLWSRIPPERIEISKIWKKWINYNPFHVGRKNGELCSTNQKKFQWCILTNPSGQFSGEYISALRGCYPFKFLHVLDIT